MSNAITITIIFYKKEIAADIATICNQVAKPYEEDEKLAYIAGEIKTPDSQDIKPIVARAITEGFARVKALASRYLTHGRTTDDNQLEAILNKDGTGQLTLHLNMPQGFNAGITETIKSDMHRYIVDYAVYMILRDLLPDRAAQHLQLAEAIKQGITPLLNRRTHAPNRRPDWT